MGEKGTNTTTMTSTPNQGAMTAYQQLMQRGYGVANTPYQAYTGNLTAGVNAQQNLGIGNINTASQAGSPWFDYAASMAHPLAQSDIERYQNPYTQHVVDATQAQFDRSNAQQQEGLKGREISQGALGGSRARISAADMGYQQQQGQAPVIAGLYNQSYNQALQAAQQQQQAGFQGAGVGANIQQAGLQGAGAQIGAGTLQQQAEQAALSAQYGQYQQAQAFPYQQTQWLAGLDTGVGSQMGGTSTTTAPKPSIFGQFAGLGTAAAGAYLGAKSGTPSAWRGGGVGYDAGGSVGSDPYGGVGFIPQMKISGGHGAPSPPAAFQPPKSNFDPSKLAFPRSGVGKDDFSGGLPGEKGFGTDAAPLGGASPEEAAAAGAEPSSFMSSFMPEGFGAGLEGAGASVMGGLEGVGAGIMSALPEGVAAALPFLLLNRGGGVRGYQAGGVPGGDPEPYYPYGDTDQAYDEDAPPAAGVGAAPSPEIPQWLPDAVGGAQNALSGNRGSFPTLSSRPSPDTGAAFMKARAPAGVAPPPAYDDMAYDDSRSPAAGVGAPPPSRSGGFDWSSLSMPLMAAGLGMMASRSPHPGVAIGEGGLAGLGAYAEQKRQTIEQGNTEKKQALDARRLDQMARQSREHLALQTRQQNFHEKQADRPYTEMTAAEKARYAQERIQVLPGYNTTDGHPIGRDMKHPDQPVLDLITGERVTPDKMSDVQTTGWKPFGDKVTEEGNPVLYDKGGNLRDAVTKMPIPQNAKLRSAKEVRLGDQSLAIRGNMLAGGDIKGAFAGLPPISSGGNVARQQVTDFAHNQLIDTGMDPKEAAAHLSAQTQAFNANGVGLSSEARTAGVREANLKIILKAADAAIPAALEASEKAWRVPGMPGTNILNGIIQKGQVVSSNPELKEFGMANLQLAEHWARAMNPTGVMRESDRDMALKFLSTTDSPTTYARAVAQLKKQIDRELSAVRSVKEHGGSGAKLAGGDQAITRGEVNKELGASAAPAAGTPAIGERKQFKQGWGVWDGSKWAPEKG